jgi:transcription elongation factor Elf1
MQEYGYLANKEVHNNFTCLVCNNINPGFNWSDLHGEAMCNVCGTPYQIVQYDNNDKRIEAEPKINIKDDWIDILREYWNETHQYIGLGVIMVKRDYPECTKGRELFFNWLDKKRRI